jgi:hypothetical protein
MEGYERPIILTNEETAEGIYAASGGVEVAGGGAGGAGGAGGEGDFGSKPSCDSLYMGGVFRAPDWNNTTSNIGRYGCNGCVANRGDQRCVLTDPELEDPGTWASYRMDDGNRKPLWEKNGYTPDGFTYNPY